MRIEIIMYVGKNTMHYLVYSHRLIIKGRTSNWNKDINQIKEEKRSQDDKRTLLKLLIPKEEIKKQTTAIIG